MCVPAVGVDSHWLTRLPPNEDKSIVNSRAGHRMVLIVLQIERHRRVSKKNGGGCSLHFFALEVIPNGLEIGEKAR